MKHTMGTSPEQQKKLEQYRRKERQRKREEYIKRGIDDGNNKNLTEFYNLQWEQQKQDAIN